MKKALIGLGIITAAAAAVLAYTVVDPFADESDPSTRRVLSGSACQRLAGLAGQLAEEDPEPGAFLAVLGREAAGIRSGSRGFADLLRGGRNRIAGKGFLARFDDGTQGQVRHFSGIAVATIFASGNPTLWISRHLRHDKKGSPDDHLTEQGVAFATAVLRGDLELEQTEDWINTHLCRRR